MVKAVAFLLLSFQSIGYAGVFNNVPDDKVLIRIDSFSLQADLPKKIRFLTWNIEKAKAGLKWEADFKALSGQSDLIFLQESMNDDYIPLVLREKTEPKEWWMAQAWADKNNKTTGVMTGASALSLSQLFMRSPVNEPIANTPKMALIQKYSLENSKTLLAINVHGINFVTNNSFYKQMTQLIDVIKSELTLSQDLKIIFSGDFNTWNSSRLNFLLKNLAPLGLEIAELKNDNRRLKLDHIFTYGCAVESAEVLNQVKSSDHYPLFAVIYCD